MYKQISAGPMDDLLALDDTTLKQQAKQVAKGFKEQVIRMMGLKPLREAEQNALQKNLKAAILDLINVFKAMDYKQIYSLNVSGASGQPSVMGRINENEVCKESLTAFRRALREALVQEGFLVVDKLNPNRGNFVVPKGTGYLSTFIESCNIYFQCACAVDPAQRDSLLVQLGLKELVSIPMELSKKNVSITHPQSEINVFRNVPYVELDNYLPYEEAAVPLLRALSNVSLVIE